jgi:hypothetical protein
MEIIADTLMEHLDCNKEQAEFLTERILEDLDKESLHITTTF